MFNKWSSMDFNGPKWSKKIYHKFNRIAFITRFKLVLVWSKIDQIFDLKDIQMGPEKKI